MKKSIKYAMAMVAVVDSPALSADEKIELIEQLLEDKNLAEYVENREVVEE